MLGSRDKSQIPGKAAPPWIWTLAISLALAVGVAVSGIAASRQVATIAERPPGNLADDAFRQMARRVGALETLWEKALDEAATEILENSGRSGAPAERVVGVEQWSYFTLGLADLTKHLRPDGRPPTVRPVLERFARGEDGEWVLDEAELFQSAGWLEVPGRPLAWWRGNGRSAVLLVVDPKRAAAVVAADLRGRFSAEPLPITAGRLVWHSPSGEPWLAAGAGTGSAPNEILRQVSRFGDWTLGRIYPVHEVVSWRLPVLGTGLGLAVLLAGGGFSVAMMQRKAMRLAEERVTFVNRVSHELRTPLTNLLLNTDLALDGMATRPDKLGRRLGLIREETERLSRIVDNVLSFARIERRQPSRRQDPDEAAAVVASVMESFAPLFERKSIRCEFNNQLEGGLPVERDAFAQILANLLSNVEKYAGESATARVTLRHARASGQLIVEVEDDGPGVPAESRHRVFEPFQRATSSVTEGASGTGLGLTISRELAREIGGSLELVPTSRGAKFRLVLPGAERSAR